MRKYEPKYRWKISKGQLQILQFIYMFRFVTSDMLAEVLRKNRSTIYERLAVLEQQGYILKQYNSSYRIRQRPATYCLAPAGIRALKDRPRMEQISLRQNYKNKSFTEQQIDDCLLLPRLYGALARRYSDRFVAYTKYQLLRKNCVQPAPLLYLWDKKTENPQHYFVDFIPAGTLTWAITRRIRQHQERGYEVGSSYPHVLIVAGNENTKRRIIKLTSMLYDDFKILTVTLECLLNSNEQAIWYDPRAWLDFGEGAEVDEQYYLKNINE